jgi:uncharacterized membrane protein (DUF485 family)
VSIDNTEALMADPRFKKLVRERSTLSWTLTAIMLIIYFGFILLVAFNKQDGEILSAKVGGGTTSVAIVAGFLILIATFIITAIYVAVANSKFDAMTDDVRREFGR